MKRNSKKSKFFGKRIKAHPQKRDSRQKLIREDKYADYQIDWPSVIPVLEERSIVKWEQVSFLSVMGDAPKDFITDRETQIKRRTRQLPFDRSIAKVGSKFYPIESVTEQFLTRIGQCFGLRIADSKLRIVAGQVRFMSKFFLRKGEQLTHGAEILALSIGKHEYKQIEENKSESEYFSTQMVCEAIQNAFPEEHDEIIGDLISMLSFDALIGHNDRHPYNWGVVVPITKVGKPRFSPIYDTARASFWNDNELQVQRRLENKQEDLESFVRKCKIPFGWDGAKRIDFFDLIGLIWNSYERYRENVETLLSLSALKESVTVLDNEFDRLMSAERRELIKQCLYIRHKFLVTAVEERRRE